MSRKVFIMGMIALLLGSWLQVTNLAAGDSAGELDACYARCWSEWSEGKFYCYFLIGQITECLENNDAAYDACKELCDRKYEL